MLASPNFLLESFVFCLSLLAFKKNLHAWHIIKIERDCTGISQVMLCLNAMAGLKSASLPLADNEDLKHSFTPGNFLRIAGEVAGKAYTALFDFVVLPRIWLKIVRQGNHIAPNWKLKASDVLSLNQSPWHSNWEMSCGDGRSRDPLSTWRALHFHQVGEWKSDCLSCLCWLIKSCLACFLHFRTQILILDFLFLALIKCNKNSKTHNNSLPLLSF